MAEEKEVKKEAAPKKGKKGKGGKKGKMLVFIVLAAVLGGGGFFGMKMAKGSEPEKPSLKLGDDAHVLNLGEFMVNTADGGSFLKATVIVHMADGTSLLGEGGKKGTGPSVEAMAAYVDSVREVLSSQTVSSLTSASGEEALKVKLADKLNDLYKKRNPKAELPKVSKDGAEPHWNSDKGPVLVVYLTELIWEN